LKNLRMLELRRAAGQTQREIAKTIGISQSSYCMIEGGQRYPRKNVQKKLVDFFGVTVDELFFAEYDHKTRVHSL